MFATESLMSINRANSYLGRVKSRILKNLFSSYRYIRFIGRHEIGRCRVCGKKSLFLADKINIKESLYCIYCGAWFRIRFLAFVILKIFSKENSTSLKALTNEKIFSQLKVYEAAAQGSIHAAFEKMPNYVCSEYFVNQEIGISYKGVRCEDLQHLTFDDSEFDLILHTSVLEHVRKPILALKESYRILKKDGYLIFEIPMTDPWENKIRSKSLQRVDTSKESDVILMKPVYHADPVNPEQGALVYTDFGLDIIDTLENIGFDVLIENMYLKNSYMSHVVVFICRK